MRVIRRIGWVILLSVWVSAWADVALYQGLPTDATGITLQGWGSGKVEDSEELSFVGSRSLKVTTRGVFSGGWLIFRNPIDLRADMNAPDKVIRFTFRFPGTTTAPGGGGAPRGPRGGPGGLGEGGDLAGGPRGPQGGPGAPLGGTGGGATTQTTPPNMETVRVVYQTTDGKTGEFMLPVRSLRASETGWQSVSVPLSAIPGLKETNGQIARIGLFGDTSGVFYVGEIRTLSEQTPIQGYIYVMNAYGSGFSSRNQQKIIIATNDELTFYGVSESGSLPVVFRWSFGGDPSQIDGEGNGIRHRFPKRGNYVVYLTIADPYGQRKPYTTQIEIQVN
ncbi:MAG: PKD domain-containing protein [Armatimonadetes bacterium]|nr:PKD domain-containing protein [Armatimonadota bacterium]CUU34490.1 PKD domain-containing protein [Armatimonadetes bacterium DC]